MPAPEDFGLQLIKVPPGSDIHLTLRLEAVLEGVLLTGTARMRVSGECARCLAPIEGDQAVDLQELYPYADKEVDDSGAVRLDGDLLDLEPVLRDAVVPALPFSPRCAPDCPGLCVECGARLADEPDHVHEVQIDPRWEALRGLPSG